MPCRPFSAGGMTGFVCGPRQKAPRCRCGSGKPAELLCDWIMPETGTCDAALCADCTTSPAPDKDLCLHHAEEWERWKAAKKAKPRPGA